MCFSLAPILVLFGVLCALCQRFDLFSELGFYVALYVAFHVGFYVVWGSIWCGVYGVRDAGRAGLLDAVVTVMCVSGGL